MRHNPYIFHKTYCKMVFDDNLMAYCLTSIRLHRNKWLLSLALSVTIKSAYSLLTKLVLGILVLVICEK